MSTALAMRAAAPLSPPSGAGFGTAVQTLEGCVSAFFALEQYDRRDGVANYTLRVVNRTRSALVCRTWVISRTGDAMLAHPILIEVAPLSTTATHVPVWPGDFGSFERAIAEIAGDGVHCIVEAPAPVRRRPHQMLAILSAASASAGIVALVAALTLRALLPPIAPIRTVPPHLSPRPHGSAEIESISVNPVVAKPGESVSVAYAAMGDGGYVQLVGSDGTIWQQRPFSRQGQAAFVIPPLSSSREMRVLVHVTRGRTAAQSMAGLVVANQTPAATPNLTGQIVGDDSPNAAAPETSDSNGTFELRDGTVKSGGSIHVRILSPRNGMRLSLTDAQSHEIAAVDVGADATDVTLRAPVVYVPTRYTVVASFTDGFGQESVVAPVTVTP